MVKGGSGNTTLLSAERAALVLWICRYMDVSNYSVNPDNYSVNTDNVHKTMMCFFLS